ncbi:MAG: flagellar hook-associated protein FlgL [Betaproteobacteria bacterium]|nr:flagellar hook-associated protein FlgL [Betaproteobacteria bacterium]
MRISTMNFYDVGTRAMLDQQSALLKTQQQVSTGRRITVPSDDPVAAARALVVSQSEAMNLQFGNNRDAAKTSLGLVDSVLDSVGNVIQDLRSMALEAGDGVLSTADRQSLATAMQGRFNELLGLANSRDGSGNYMFSGFQVGTQPFVPTGGSVSYNGDDGALALQVAASRQMGVTASGRDVFERIRNGNGVFQTAAAGANTGTGIINQGSVVNASLLTGQNYAIVFTVAAGVTTYDLINTTTATTISAGNPFTPNAAITVDGMQVQIEGAPANGDQFTLTPSANQSLFTTISDLITALQTPAASPTFAAPLANALGRGIANFDQALDNVLKYRADTGAKLNEVDSLDDTGEAIDIQFKQQLSELQDVDYAEAISRLTRQQAFLEAAQKSFIKVVSNKLFDYI